MYDPTGLKRPARGPFISVTHSKASHSLLVEDNQAYDGRQDKNEHRNRFKFGDLRNNDFKICKLC